MEEYCSERRGRYIFNDNSNKRYQVPFTIEKLPLRSLKIKFNEIRRFLRAALPFCEPRNWVCLASLRGCERQVSHTDYDTDLIRRATRGGDNAAAFPFACKCSCLNWLACSMKLVCALVFGGMVWLLFLAVQALFA